MLTTSKKDRERVIMESKKYKHERYLSKLEKHLDAAKESSKYSSDRFDILIVSLSTSALVLSIGFVKI